MSGSGLLLTTGGEHEEVVTSYVYQKGSEGKGTVGTGPISLKRKIS